MAKITDFIRIDIREGDNLSRLKRAVLKTKWFSRFTEDQLTLETIETGYRKVSEKYDVGVSYIMRASAHSWSVAVQDFNTHKWVESFTAMSLYEAMCKTMLVLYAYVELGIKFRSEDK